MAGVGEAEQDGPRGGASRDEFAGLERAADPLHRAGINPKLLSDLAHARPSFQFWSYPRPSEPHTLSRARTTTISVRRSSERMLLFIARERCFADQFAGHALLSY